MDETAAVHCHSEKKSRQFPPLLYYIYTYEYIAYSVHSTQLRDNSIKANIRYNNNPSCYMISNKK